jgi:hypothetical protein
MSWLSSAKKRHKQPFHPKIAMENRVTFRKVFLLQHGFHSNMYVFLVALTWCTKYSPWSSYLEPPDCSVANWPKFRPQNTKVAPEKSQQPEETAAEFFADFSKNGRKVAELFYVWS